MTIASRPKGLPLSEAARIDQQIGERVRRITSGRANASEIAEISQLIRERADLMMPRIFTEGAGAQQPGDNLENARLR
jgi:hypothetical protein